MNYLRYEREERIGLVTLNRPERGNALSEELLTELRELWSELARDDAVRVVILKGEGRGFCAGADLAAGGGQRQARKHTVANDRQGILNGLLATCFQAWDLPKPVISQVHGYCFAGGTLLTTLTDMVFVAEDAVIGWPKLPVGGGLISPTWSWMVGPYRAKEFSLTVGRTFTGAESVAMGWGNRAVAAQDLADVTRQVAERIAKVPADLLALKKFAINKQLDVQGFRAAVQRGAEMDAIAHTSQAVHAARALIREHGLKGAIEVFQREGLA